MKNTRWCFKQPSKQQIALDYKENLIKRSRAKKKEKRNKKREEWEEGKGDGEEEGEEGGG